MGVYEGKGQISKGMKDLTNAWAQTRMEWDDEVAEQFAKRYLEPLERELKSATGAMDHMATVMSQVRRDCQ